MKNYSKFLDEQLKIILHSAEILGMNKQEIIDIFIEHKERYEAQQIKLNNIRKH